MEADLVTGSLFWWMEFQCFQHKGTKRKDKFDLLRGHKGVLPKVPL